MYEAIIFVWCWLPETSTGLPPAVSSDPLSLDQDSWIGFSFQQFYSVTGCFLSLTNPDEPLHRFSQNLAVLTLATVLLSLPSFSLLRTFIYDQWVSLQCFVGHWSVLVASITMLGLVSCIWAAHPPAVPAEGWMRGGVAYGPCTFSVWKRWPFLQRFVSCKAMKVNIAKTWDLWKWPSFQIIYFFFYRKITSA